MQALSSYSNHVPDNITLNQSQLLTDANHMFQFEVQVLSAYFTAWIKIPHGSVPTILSESCLSWDKTQQTIFES